MLDKARTLKQRADFDFVELLTFCLEVKNRSSASVVDVSRVLAMA